MNKLYLTKIRGLYEQAKDAYNPENSDHEHLKECLVDVLEILHREGIYDDGLAALEFGSLGGIAND